MSFHGPHQAGVTTPQQAHLRMAALDLQVGTAADLADLLRAWTRAAELMTGGRSLGDASGLAPPVDTGESADLDPARLTVTIGFGASLLHRLGMDDRRRRR